MTAPALIVVFAALVGLCAALVGENHQKRLAFLVTVMILAALILFRE